LIEMEAFKESGQRWREIADEIHAEVYARGFDPDLNSFVQAYGCKRLDARLLLIPLVGFLPATDPRIQGTQRFLILTLPCLCGRSGTLDVEPARRAKSRT